MTRDLKKLKEDDEKYFHDMLSVTDIDSPSMTARITITQLNKLAEALGRLDYLQYHVARLEEELEYEKNKNKKKK